jgi:hypothetical protein
LVQRGILFLVLGAALAVAVQELTEFVTSPARQQNGEQNP